MQEYIPIHQFKRCRFCNFSINVIFTCQHTSLKNLFDKFHSILFLKLQTLKFELFSHFCSLQRKKIKEKKIILNANTHFHHHLFKTNKFARFRRKPHNKCLWKSARRGRRLYWKRALPSTKCRKKTVRIKQKKCGSSRRPRSRAANRQGGGRPREWPSITLAKFCFYFVKYLVINNHEKSQQIFERNLFKISRFLRTTHTFSQNENNTLNTHYHKGTTHEKKEESSKKRHNNIEWLILTAVSTWSNKHQFRC